MDLSDYNLRDLVNTPHHIPRMPIRSHITDSVEPGTQYSDILFERPKPTNKNPFPAPKMGFSLDTPPKSYKPYGDKDLQQYKLVLVMVGLPARGKTFIGRKIWRYLSWIGLKISLFNIGSYRRKHFSHQTVGRTSKAFFDMSSTDAVKTRREIAKLALEDMVLFLSGEGQVGILDGTNSTVERRKLIREFLGQKGRELGMRFKILHVESICTCEDLIEKNILSTKLSNPDYMHVNPEAAVKDFRARIRQYETVYVPLSKRDGSFIKLINAGEQVIGHEVHGYIECRLMYFLMHLNLNRKSIFLTRHGECEWNVQGRVGGDEPLSPAGRNYAKALANWFDLQSECSRVNITVRGFTTIAGTYILQTELVNGMPCYNNNSKDCVIWFYTDSRMWVITKLEFVGKRSISESQLYAMLEEDGVITPENGDVMNWWIWDPESGEKLSASSFNLMVVRQAGCKLWCSTMTRTIQTCSHFQRVVPVKWRALSGQEVGSCDGLTHDEIRDNFPDEFYKRQEDKLRYRYPGGESYRDVIHRLEPVIFEIERSQLPVIIVGHKATLRCLYGYFKGTPVSDIPHLNLPLHVVFKLYPGPYGTDVSNVTFNLSKDGEQMKTETNIDAEVRRLGDGLSPFPLRKVKSFMGTNFLAF